MIPFEQTLTALSKTPFPVEKICSSSAYWIPLQWLYVRMIENKDLIPISSLPKEKKLEYWNLVLKLRPDKSQRWVRIMMCQAIYVYDNL